MYFLHDLYRLFEWFSANGGAHATVFLVIITAIYVFLTGRMTTAMARQTRAMIQPVLSLKLEWFALGSDPGLTGRVFIENQGNQPAVLLDAYLECVVDGRGFEDRFDGLDESIIVPQSNIALGFDFEKRAQGAKARSERGVGWALHVVAADIGRVVVLEYIYWPVLTLRVCRVRYPLRVRIKYLRRSIRVRYHRLRRFVDGTDKADDGKVLSREEIEKAIKRLERQIDATIEGIVDRGTAPNYDPNSKSALETAAYLKRACERKESLLNYLKKVDSKDVF